MGYLFKEIFNLRSLKIKELLKHAAKYYYCYMVGIRSQGNIGPGIGETCYCLRLRAEDQVINHKNKQDIASCINIHGLSYMVLLIIKWYHGIPFYRLDYTCVPVYRLR